MFINCGKYQKSKYNFENLYFVFIYYARSIKLDISRRRHLISRTYKSNCGFRILVSEQIDKKFELIKIWCLLISYNAGRTNDFRKKSRLHTQKIF